MPEGSLRCHKSPQGVTRMHILWVCVLYILPGRSLALTGPNTITARVGSTVTIPCQYENDYTNYQKYWCRGWFRLFCSVVVESTHQSRQGRTSISDNRRHHTFTVTMDELREDDTGYYWCGVSAPGRDPMLFVQLTVLRDSSSVNPTAEILSLPTEASTTTEAEPSKALEETVLEIFVPIMAVLLFLLLLTTALFLRERRRRKQGMKRETSKSKTMHNSDMSPDLSTMYAVIEKADNADAQTACMENTAISTEPVDCSEEGQPSPTISETFPMYAVVKKAGASRSQGIDNPAMDTARPEHHYEEIQFPPVAPHTIPVYAVVKRVGARKASENQTSTIKTVTGEDCCEEKMLRRREVSGTTDPSTASDQQLELHSTVDFTDMAPSEEPQYCLLTK